VSRIWGIRRPAREVVIADDIRSSARSTSTPGPPSQPRIALRFEGKAVADLAQRITSRTVSPARSPGRSRPGMAARQERLWSRFAYFYWPTPEGTWDPAARGARRMHTITVKSEMEAVISPRRGRRPTRGGGCGSRSPTFGRSTHSIKELRGLGRASGPGRRSSYVTRLRGVRTDSVSFRRFRPLRSSGRHSPFISHRVNSSPAMIGFCAWMGWTAWAAMSWLIWLMPTPIGAGRPAAVAAHRPAHEALRHGGADSGEISPRGVLRDGNCTQRESVHRAS
jgi:hypothetical protein